MNNNTRSLMLTCGALVFVLALLFGVGAFLFGDQVLNAARDAFGRWQLSNREPELIQPLGTDPTPRAFVIDSGESPIRIAQRLETEGFIGDSELLFDYVRYEGFDRQLASGTFFLNSTMSIKDVVDALVGDTYRAINFTMLAGWRLEEVAAAIDVNPRFTFDGASFLGLLNAGAAINPDLVALARIPAGVSHEGFLFEGTYALPPNISADGLRDTLIDAFLEVVTGDITMQASQQGLTLYQVVTLASIVEREAVHEDEMPRIASVYRNRLSAGMKLDADPTVQYGLGNTRGTYWPRITQADYQGVQSDYNTYLISGLPPGPIASPSIAAMLAVLSPEETNYLFMRADCRTDGYHDYAVTYEEHLANGC